MRAIEELLERNRAWADATVERDPQFFRRLSQQQRPRFLWIGCSDSRVPANQITDLDPGEMFVHRNVANVVSAADLNLLSVVQFAVDVLGVGDIIVCGHYGCGGVEAVLDGRRHGLVDHWLHEVEEIRERHRVELDALVDRGSRFRRLCELNVEAQVDRLSRTAVIRDAWGRGAELALHGWIYGLEDGRLRDLAVTRRDPSSD